MKNANIKKAVFRWVGILCLSILGLSSIQAQSLLTNVGDPGLDREQEIFLKTVTDNVMNHSLQFVEVNVEALRGNSFTFQPNKNESYTVINNQRGEKYAGLTSWCGTIDNGTDFGDVNMVVNGDELVAHIQIGSQIFALTPLGKGIHAFYEVDSSLMPKEECEHGREPNYNYTPSTAPKFKNEDMLLDEGAPKATGECKIRVLIGFTTSAQNQFTSILAQLVNQVNLANAAYDNAGVGFNIELALAYNVGYVETGNLGTDLDRWEFTNDGFMDEVHSNRTLFDADMCALIVNDGGGLANLSLAYDKTFSVTGTGNFNVFTFHHELGHNMLCTHDLINPDQPGSAPYAGYGEPTTSCFRTILAYQEACGTPGFSCPRVNVFSRSVGTYTCGGNAYAKGGPNNRNRDRLVLSKDAINNHTTVPVSTTYGADYNWFNQEAINFAAESSIGYSSATNNWDMFSGSEGSFRASDEVTLGDGFWARSGSTFTAYLETCTDISPDEAALAVVDPDYEPENETFIPNSDGPAEGSKFFHDLTVFPNPFMESTTVQFNFHGDQRVSITLMDILGREMMQIANAAEFAEGQHRIEIQTSDLPSGIYLITLRAGDDVMVKRIVKGN